MRRNLIDSYQVENPTGKGIISVRHKSGCKFMSVNKKLHFIEWPLGTPTVDFFYKISNHKIALSELLNFQENTRNLNTEDKKSISGVVNSILYLMETGIYEIEFYQDISEEIHYHFDRINFNQIKNSMIREFEDKWWNKKGIENQTMERILDHPLEKEIDQYYSSWQEDYSYYLSTQSIKSIDFELVEKYKNEINNGSKPLIIVTDYSLILDGHHKAVAYSLTDKKPYILRIRKTTNKAMDNQHLIDLKSILNPTEFEHFINEFEK